MDGVFAAIENSPLSVWIRETPSIFAYPTIITLHVIAIAFLAGGSTAIDLRILGFAPGIGLSPMRKFFPLLWLAFGLNAVTGTLLLIGYPTKAFTNPVFYIKLGLIAFGMTLLHKIRVEVLEKSFEGVLTNPRSRFLALASILVWAAIITAGRYLGYTYTWELVGVRAVL
jgi:hypothetical protein